MKKRLLILISAMVLGISLLAGGGTYALMTASTANEGNQFSTFEAGVVDIGSSSDSALVVRSFMMSARYRVTFPMFYDSASYPTGPNPYDVSTGVSPSGEILGGWAPGDQVTRTWDIDNRGNAAKITEIYVPAKSFSLTDQTGNTLPAGSQAYNDFLEYMKITVYSQSDDSTPLYTGTLKQLVSAAQPLDGLAYLPKKCTRAITLKFVAAMDPVAGNDLQGVKGVLDFVVGAEQVRNNCFRPPFSNRQYSMLIGSTTPIKFECFDKEDSFITSCQNVKLVISGPGLGDGLTYTVGSGLSFNGGHYQANVYADPALFVEGGTYTATVYIDSKAYCQKSFSTEPGNRSNAPD